MVSTSYWLEVARDRLERGGLHLAAGLDELDRLERLQRVAEVVAHRALQHLADEVAHGADHRDDLRRLRVGHVDLHLQVDLEDEALAALAHDRRQLRVEVVRLGRGVGPVEREDERGHDLRRVHARVDRVLAGAQRFLPDAAVTGAHDRTELELGARRVGGRQSDEALDDRDLALVHHEHRHEVDAHEERVQQVRAVEQRVVLQSDLAAVVEERLEVLVVVVQRVLAAEQQVDELGVGGGGAAARVRRLDGGDVVEPAEPAGDVARRQRLALERGDHADEVDAAGVGRDHHDAQLVGREPERLRAQAPCPWPGSRARATPAGRRRSGA